MLCSLAVVALSVAPPQASLLSEEVEAKQTAGATHPTVCAEPERIEPFAASLIQRASAFLAGSPRELEVSFTAMMVGGFIGMGFLLGVWMWLYTHPRAEGAAAAEEKASLPQDGSWWWAPAPSVPAWSAPPQQGPVEQPQAQVSYAPPPPAPSATPVWAQKMPGTPERPNPERKFDTYEYRHAEQNPSVYLPSEQEGDLTVPAAAESLRAPPGITPVPAPNSSKRRRQQRGSGSGP